MKLINSSFKNSIILAKCISYTEYFWGLKTSTILKYFQIFDV